MSSGDSESIRTVLVAMATNLAIAIAKGIVAAITGSASLTAETIHSFVDTANEGILFYGLHRSQKPPNERHPFGYGRELYFWTLVVAVTIFGIGGGVTIVEGIDRILHPHALENPFWSYVVLGIAFALEGASWVVSYRAVMRESNGSNVIETIRASKDPTTFSVLVEDTAAITGLVLAFAGTIVGHATGNVRIDGIASLAIGVVLAAVAVFLVGESRALLVGESARPETVASIRAFVRTDDAVAGLERVIAMQLAPQRIVVFLNVHFRSVLSLAEVISAIGRIEAGIRERHADVATIFIEPTSPARVGSDDARPRAAARAEIARRD